MRIVTTISSGLRAPAGGFHNCASRARSASSSLCESCAAVPLARRATAVSLSVSPVASLRCGVALVEQRLHLARIELRLVLRLRRPLRRRRDFRVGFLRVRLLLLGLLGGVLLDRFGDQVALGLGLLLGLLLGLRRRRRWRRIGRRGDLLRRDLGVRIVDRPSVRRSSRRTDSSPPWARSSCPRVSCALVGVGDDVDRNALDLRRRQPRRRKAHQRRAQNDERGSTRIWSSPSATAYLLSCSGMTSIFAPKPVALDAPQQPHHVRIADFLVAPKIDVRVEFLLPGFLDRFDLGFQLLEFDRAVAEVVFGGGAARAARLAGGDGQLLGLGLGRDRRLGLRQIDRDRRPSAAAPRP